MKKRERPLWVGVVLLVVLLALLFTRTARSSGGFHANPVDPPLPMPELVLGAGEEIFRSGQLQGSHAILFFGFTRCPDVCPLTLQRLAAARELLGRRAHRLQVVFVSVDPARDDAARAAGYARAFHPSFIGVAGEEEQTRRATADYGVFARIPEPAGDHAGHGADYMVDHTASALVLNPRGELVMLFPYGQSAEEIAADLRRLLR